MNLAIYSDLPAKTKDQPVREFKFNSNQKNFGYFFVNFVGYMYCMRITW